ASRLVLDCIVMSCCSEAQHSWQSFYCIPFRIPCYSFLFLSVLFHSILFYSIRLSCPLSNTRSFEFGIVLSTLRCCSSRRGLATFPSSFLLALTASNVHPHLMPCALHLIFLCNDVNDAIHSSAIELDN